MASCTLASPSKTSCRVIGQLCIFSNKLRLAIARVVYRDPEIYIFDEATSFLDSYSEKRIQASIENLRQSKTVIAVAHRISSIINTDEILVMKDGRIIERGSHAELLSKEGFYAGLYNHQHDIKHSKKEKNIVTS